MYSLMSFDNLWVIMQIGYARVSTKDQELDLQINALNHIGCEKIYQVVQMQPHEKACNPH